jgi:hypothetical protein
MSWDVHITLLRRETFYEISSQDFTERIRSGDIPRQQLAALKGNSRHVEDDGHRPPMMDPSNVRGESDGAAAQDWDQVHQDCRCELASASLPPKIYMAPLVRCNRYKKNKGLNL